MINANTIDSQENIDHLIAQAEYINSNADEFTPVAELDTELV